MSNKYRGLQKNNLKSHERFRGQKGTMNVEEKAELINERAKIVSFLGVNEKALKPHLMQTKCVIPQNILSAHFLASLNAMETR